MNKKLSRDEYYKKASSWDQEIIANALHSRRRAWIITGASMLISVLSLLALLFLLPLKTFEPYIVTVDRNTGYMEVTKVLENGTLSQDQAITESNLVKYVSLREQYNPAILKENYSAITLMSEKTALKEWQQLWSAQNPKNPSILLGKNTNIDVKIKSVSFLNDKTASVRFLKETHEETSIKISHWNTILQFHYSQKPMRMADRFSNPLGFQVISYRVNPESLENIK